MPIISSIGITIDFLLINVNADLEATALAITLNTNLMLLSDISSILDGKRQRILEMNNIKAQHLTTQGIITNGMIISNVALELDHILGRSIDIESFQNTEELKLLFNGINISIRVYAS